MKLVNPHSQTLLQPGEVALVGAGPGDPELLTLKAYHLMQQSDVVIYDRLVSDDIMAMLPAQCERFYVGKEQAKHCVPQDGINQMLVQQAKRGKRVLRLKGGDPFVFGRGGEEVEVLLAEGINCYVVPGITSASGCTTYAGIPLTHRGIAQGCTFITGHLQNDGQLNLPWTSLVANSQTLVFYMGINTLAVITQKLIAHGRHADTPAALIRNGTRPDQQVFKGTLASLPDLVEKHQITPPTLVVIGQVVDQFSDNLIASNGYYLANTPAELQQGVAS